MEKQKLLEKIKSLETELKKVKSCKRYWLVWEDKPEKFEEEAKGALPILKEEKSLKIETPLLGKEGLGVVPNNIIIEWDNFHSLSALSYTHKGKIDVIYIDPPYNTWNKDFIYNDRFVDKEDSYRHSKWLSFMNKRLKLAKDLLSDDWVIFMSIDDNEFSQLKLLWDEILWQENFISSIIWKKTENIKMDSKYLSVNTEYILLYKKWLREWLNKELSWTERYKLKDEKWIYYLRKLDSKSSTYSKWMDYTIEYEWKKYYAWWDYNKYLDRQKKAKAKDSTWLWSKSKYEEWLKNWEIIFKNWNVYNKVRYDWIAKKPFISLIDNVSWQTGQKELDNIFDNRAFDHPKPSLLIKHLLQISSKPNSIILDFFAGSGTTGHAVMELNKQDSGNRQFILCSNRENTKEEPEKNICRNITYERNKRVIEWYTNSKWEEIEGLGGNLRYYTTKFIKADKSIDDLRYSFIDMCDDLLLSRIDIWRCRRRLRCRSRWSPYH